MQSSALAYLRKVVAIRKALLRCGKSGKPVGEMMLLLAPIDAWLKHWGKSCQESGALKMIYKHQAPIREIIPGGEKGCGPALRQQLNDFINQYEKENEHTQIQSS